MESYPSGHKEAVLKAAQAIVPRGFESLTLRHFYKTEAYRSGHNGPASKTGYRSYRYVGSNPTASANSQPGAIMSPAIF